MQTGANNKTCLRSIWIYVFANTERAKMCKGIGSRPRYISHLSIATWNIQGLKGNTFNKTDDMDFMSKIGKHHIIGLTETHCIPSDNIVIPGYHAFQASRPKTKNKAHGGVAIIVKETIRPGVKFFKGESNDIVWIQLMKEYFNMEKDTFIGCTYVSPKNSSYSRGIDRSPFDILNKDINKFSEKGRILLMGDFNARTGN